MSAVVHGGLHDRELAALGLEAEQVLDLSSNVNPYGPHPEVLSAVRRADSFRYPDPSGWRTRCALARHAGVEPEQVVLGAGAAALMWDLARATLRPGQSVVLPEPCFGEYRPALEAAGARILSRPDGAQRPRSVWVGSPDNPLGRLLSEQEEQSWAERVELAVFDHAFLSLTEAHARRWRPGTVSLRSITKDHALPGVRAGWAIAPAEVVARIEAGRPPWSSSAPARAALEASLLHELWLADCRARLWADRAALVEGLERLGYTPRATDTLWVLLPVADPAAVRRRLLEEHHIAVRDCTSFGLPGLLRIRCGPGQDRLLAALGGPPAAPPPGPRVTRPRRDLLVLELGQSAQVLSHAPIGGGWTRARAVALLGLRDADLPPDRDPLPIIRARLPAGAVGLATSRSLDAHIVERRAGLLCVATVGLSNRLRVGDPAHGPPAGGTINVILWVEQRLSEAAMSEALALAAAARTTAVREAGLDSVLQTGPATGTGTDCIAIGCPSQGPAAPWAGMHTRLGSDIGGIVHTAVHRGVRAWVARFLEPA